MEKITDTLETLILMALDAKHEHSIPSTVRREKNRGVAVLHDQGELLKIGEMHPHSSYTFDMTDADRIFALEKELLLAHPSDVLGDESEVMMMNDDVLKWYGFRRLKQSPRDIACLGRASHWYEMHMRCVMPSGYGEYFKRVIPLNRDGNPLVAKVQGHDICNPRIEGEQLVLCASIIEDAYRANTMLASVKDATEIKFPVPIDDYKNVFADRDGPMNGSRKKAILHWVAKHLRRSSRDKKFEVKRHTRGIQEFTIEGIRILLAPNDGFKFGVAHAD